MLGVVLETTGFAPTQEMTETMDDQRQRRFWTVGFVPALLFTAIASVAGCTEPDCAPETIVVAPATADAGGGDGGPDACLAICDAAPERPTNKTASSCQVVVDGISCTYTQFCEG